LRKFAPPTTPQEKPPTHVVASSSEALDAVVRLLMRKGLFTSTELTEELDRTKSRKVVVPV